MAQSLKAIYRDGAFVPQTPCDLPDGAEVWLTVRASEVEPPAEPDPEERQRILARMVERMKANPLAPDAPRLTREEMHERR